VSLLLKCFSNASFSEAKIQTYPRSRKGDGFARRLLIFGVSREALWTRFHHPDRLNLHFQLKLGGIPMNSLLIRLMVLAALTQFGITLASSRDYTSGRGPARIEKASRDVLRVDWKPLSVFPEEARKFR
jgi:hypothetical protein